MGGEGFIQDPATKETKRFHRDERAGPGTPRSLSTLGCRYPVSRHSSRRVCTCVGMLQSSCGRSCIVLAGNKWNLAGELLLSPRAKGGLRPFLYVKGSKFHSKESTSDKGSKVLVEVTQSLVTPNQVTDAAAALASL